MFGKRMPGWSKYAEQRDDTVLTVGRSYRRRMRSTEGWSPALPYVEMSGEESSIRILIRMSGDRLERNSDRRKAEIE